MINTQKEVNNKNNNNEKRILSYIDICIRKYPDLLHLFPNSKEITESMGAAMALWYAVKNLDRSCPNTHVYVLGDGKTPMTGAIISKQSRFQVTSIDPRLAKPHYDNLPRLKLFKGLSQSFTDIEQDASLSIIVGVHSHAPLKEFWDRVPNPKICVVIPCCVPQNIDRDPDHEYNDIRIFSKKRTVKIWDNR
jgi:hypothetical protein